jgi:hypothetical protein
VGEVGEVEGSVDVGKVGLKDGFVVEGEVVVGEVGEWESVGLDEGR